VEWFDFYVYAFCAVYFASVFFPKGNPTAQLMNAAGVFGALGALGTVPVLSLLHGAHSPVFAALVITVALAVVSFYTSVAGIVKAEMFPVEVRALGVGLAYAVANAVFGGSAEYAALGLKSMGRETVFFW